MPNKLLWTVNHKKRLSALYNFIKTKEPKLNEDDFIVKSNKTRN